MIQAVEIDIPRARITHPDGIVSPARFVFFSDNGTGLGTAAVWQEDRRHRTATRVLYATGTYEPGKTPRHGSSFTLTIGGSWSISPLSGGCSCRNRNTLLSDYSAGQLLDDSMSSIS